MVLIDSSVLIDVIEHKPGWGEACAAALFQASRQGALCINIIIYAEISRTFASVASENDFLKRAGIALIPLPSAAAFHAARAHLAYRLAGGQRTATLPDFFIGGHASVAACPLLTRDPARVRTYFPDVILIGPENPE